jgi:hypothetical protein
MRHFVQSGEQPALFMQALIEQDRSQLWEAGTGKRHDVDRKDSS